MILRGLNGPGDIAPTRANPIKIEVPTVIPAATPNITPHQASAAGNFGGAKVTPGKVMQWADTAKSLLGMFGIGGGGGGGGNTGNADVDAQKKELERRMAEDRQKQQRMMTYMIVGGVVLIGATIAIVASSKPPRGYPMYGTYQTLGKPKTPKKSTTKTNAKTTAKINTKTRKSSRKTTVKSRNTQRQKTEKVHFV